MCASSYNIRNGKIQHHNKKKHLIRKSKGIFTKSFLSLELELNGMFDEYIRIIDKNHLKASELFAIMALLLLLFCQRETQTQTCSTFECDTEFLLDARHLLVGNWYIRQLVRSHRSQFRLKILLVPKVRLSKARFFQMKNSNLNKQNRKKLDIFHLKQEFIAGFQFNYKLFIEAYHTRVNHGKADKALSISTKCTH